MKRFITIVVLGWILSASYAAAIDFKDDAISIQSAGDALRAWFVHKGVAVQFESVRHVAPLSAEHGRAIEVAVRVRDAQGNLLASLAEGESPRGWLTPRTAARDRSASAPSTELASEVARLGFDAVLAELVKRGLKPERRAFARLAAAWPELGQTAPTALKGSGSSLALSCARTWRQGLYLHKKSIDLCDWFTDCSHGATRVKRWYSDDCGTTWTLYSQSDYCNHGTCPSQMVWKAGPCYGPTVAGSTSLVPLGHMCSTSYNWSSVSGTHNSNDDADYQKACIVKNKNYNSAAYKCDNNGQNNNAWGDCEGSNCCSVSSQWW
ncbi:MAG: hypothetical protein ACREWG_05805 [Gammaproteobacteria bacterium]